MLKKALVVSPDCGKSLEESSVVKTIVKLLVVMLLLLKYLIRKLHEESSELDDDGDHRFGKTILTKEDHH